MKRDRRGESLAGGKWRLKIRATHHILDVDVRALLEEVLHELIVTLLDGQMQGSAAALLRRIRGGGNKIHIDERCSLKTLTAPWKLMSTPGVLSKALAFSTSPNLTALYNS